MILNSRARSFKGAKRRILGTVAFLAVFVSILNLPLVASEPYDPWPSMPRKYKYLKNPLPKNEENLSSGERLYDINCSPCHGGNLDGHGPEASGFFPPPANLSGLVTLVKPPQSYLYWRIKEGGPGLPKGLEPWNSAMPVWKDELTDEEIWQIILYIYDAAGESPP